MVSLGKRQFFVVALTLLGGNFTWGQNTWCCHTSKTKIPPLPHGKSAVQVLGDFVCYLFGCARNYIIETHASGVSMWKSMENSIKFILTHPNGWEGSQHAAKIAGLIPGKKKVCESNPSTDRRGG